MVVKKKGSLKRLSAGRPPSAKLSRSMSRKASRMLINNHHQLEKQRRQALARGDHEAASRVSSQIDGIGGLDHYQKASLQGQSNDRGGDTSKVLVDWLSTKQLRSMEQPLRLLEVGALSTQNACSKSGIFDVVHIDLNSQEPGILTQDFMARPLPMDDSEKFDLISLSLVINFVPEAASRGEMLLHTLSFLRPSGLATTPAVFIVLPRSCVYNSRYFTAACLEELMGLLGYSKLKDKCTQKLYYSLWQWDAIARHGKLDFPKREVNPGRTRNNFVITLKHAFDERRRVFRP